MKKKRPGEVFEKWRLYQVENAYFRSMRSIAQHDSFALRAAFERGRKYERVDPKLLIWLYNQGYTAGHHDTVESCYTDVLPVDMDSYHDDVVQDLLAERST